MLIRRSVAATQRLKTEVERGPASLSKEAIIEADGRELHAEELEVVGGGDVITPEAPT